MKTEMIVKKLPVSMMKPAKYNPRKDLKPGDPAYEKIRRSLHEFGYVDPVIWNEVTGNIVGGHQRYKVLTAEGATEIDCVVVHIENPQEEKALNIALNKAVGEWEPVALADLLNDLKLSGYDVDATGFDAAEIDDLFSRVHDKDVKDDDCDIDPEQVEPFVQPGDIWQLGKHRMMCGDATIEADATRLMDGDKASLPLHVYQNQDEGSVKALEHPLYPILHDEPNSEMTSFVWRETMLAHLLLWGNAYCQIIRSGRSQILGLYPLLPDRMEVDRDSAGTLTYTYSTGSGQTVKLRPEDVLHIPGLGFDGIMGYSPIALEKNAIGLGLAAEEYGSKFFSNGARPSGILTHPNTVKDPKKLRDSWNAAYGGSNNSGRVAVLEENMSYTPISMPNSEAQFLETRKFQVSEICRIYRVPPHMVGDLEHATFSNIEHQSISFAVHTIRPWVVRLEQAMNRALFSDKEKGVYYVRFNMDGLMRGDYKSRMEGYAIGRQNGWMSANDIRELENMNPIPDADGGNEYLVNGNMIRIAQAAQNGGDQSGA